MLRKKKKVFKKSQMELMGLAIIVILITLGLIFTIRFIVLKKPVEYKKEYTKIELASNMINTLLRTTANDCSSVSFTELFQDCADSYPEGMGIIECGILGRSCKYLNATIHNIFEDTFEEWNTGYYFEAVAGTYTLVSDRCNDCSSTICPVRTHKEFPIPSSATTINIKLDICD